MQQWREDYYILADICSDNYELIASLIKWSGSKVKRAYILEDLNYCRMEKHYEHIDKLLSMNYQELKALIDDYEYVVKWELENKKTKKFYKLAKNLFIEGY